MPEDFEVCRGNETNEQNAIIRLREKILYGAESRAKIESRI